MRHSHDRVRLAVEGIDDLHVERPVRGEKHLAAGGLDELDHLVCACVNQTHTTNEISKQASKQATHTDDARNEVW